MRVIPAGPKTISSQLQIRTTHRFFIAPLLLLPLLLLLRPGHTNTTGRLMADTQTHTDRQTNTYTTHTVWETYAKIAWF